MSTIEQVIEKYMDKLMAINGVIGCAIGQKDNQPVIQVQISSDSDELRAQIPDQLDGFSVEVIVMDKPELF